jgi:hypothetical protein
MTDFETTVTVPNLELADKLAKLLCLPFDFMDTDIEVQIEYSYTKGFPGSWDEPPELPEIDVREVKVISTSLHVGLFDIECDCLYTFDMKIAKKQQEIIGKFVFKYFDNLETLCFEDADYHIKNPDFDIPDDYDDDILF